MLLVYLLTIPAIIFFIYETVKLFQIKSWPTTLATILSVDIEEEEQPGRGGPAKYWVPKVTYQYEFSEKVFYGTSSEYSSNSLVSKKSLLRKIEEFKKNPIVYVNPKKNTESHIMVASPILNLTVITLLSFCVYFLYNSQ